jgi:two-component system LytT family response regulator
MTKKLRALLVDDESHALQGLSDLLMLYCPEVEVVGIASTVKDAAPMFNSLKPDIAFLDVELSEGTGFDLAEVASSSGASLVFVTGHADYAQRAFTVDATHYLLKPVSYKDLRVAVARVAVRRDKEIALRTDYRVRIRTSSGMQFVHANTIVGIEGEGRYSTLYFIEGKQVVVTRNIGEYEEELAAHGFFRVHKSWLINCSHVVKLSNSDGGTIELRNGKTVLLSRRRKNEFLKRMES